MKKNLSRMLSILLVMVLTVSMLPGCSSGNTANQNPKASSATVQTKTTSGGSTITMAMVSPWDSMIPFDTTSAYSDAILDLVYDKLVYLKSDGTYTPRLADKWEMNKSNTELTVHLNEKAKWQDGQPVVADDVVFTCKLYSSPTLASPRLNNLSAFKGCGESDTSLQVVAVDKHTVKFVCKQPTNMDFIMFTKLRDVYILPSHLLKDTPLSKIRQSDYWQHPVGSGACIYDKQISGDRMEFKANKDYYLGAPKWDRFVVRVVNTPNLLSGLMNGEIDILAGNVAALQLSDWNMAQKQSNLTCISLPSVAYQYMAINTQKDYLPAKVRQAINTAIDRNLIVNGLLKGQGIAAYGPITQSNKYYNPSIEAPYDAEAAKKLLTEAGWNGSHELIMSVPTGNAIREQSAVIIQQNLEKVGIKVKIVSSDFATHLNKVRKGDYDLALIGSGGSPDPSECVINFKPKYLNNFSQLTDSTIYDTGAAGEQAFTFKDRKVSYDKYQELLKEQVPFAFLYFQNSLFAYNKRLQGVKDIEDYSQLNRDVWNWTVK